MIWLLGIVYATIPSFWLAIHPCAGWWRTRRGKIYPFLGLFWLAVIGLAGYLTFPWHTQRLYTTPWSWLAGSLFFAAGISVYSGIGKEFSREKVLGQAELHPEQHAQKLISTGMHGKVRHPFYLGHLCMLTGFTTGSGLVALYILWVFAIVSGVVMIKTEEAELEKRFGVEYTEYKKKVPAILPL